MHESLFVMIRKKHRDVSLKIHNIFVKIILKWHAKNAKVRF